MTNKEKILTGLLFATLLSIDVSNLLDIINLKNNSKYELKQMAIEESKQVSQSEYSHLKKYIEAKKQKEYYTTLVNELKPLSIKEMNDKNEKNLFIDGVYIDLYNRKYTNKKDSSITYKQIIKVSY